MYIEITVIFSLATAFPISIALLWRGGIRGLRLALASWLSLFGLLLTIMMLGHCADVVRNLSAGGQALDGTPWGYTFRTYALFLLGGVLITQGIAILGSVAALSRGDAAAWSRAMRATLYTLAAVAPLIPIHRFFALPATGVATLSLLALVLLGRGPGEQRALTAGWARSRSTAPRPPEPARQS